MLYTWVTGTGTVGSLHRRPRGADGLESGKAVAACDSWCSRRALRVSMVGSIVILLWPAIRGRSGGWNKGFDTGPFRVVFRLGTRPEV